jgi:putative ABC transport system substrate-binding protein
MTTRRKLLGMLGTMALLVPQVARAQQPAAKLARIGWLSPVSRAEDAARLNAFRQGLRDLGYVEGKHIVIEARWAQGDYGKLDALASELVRLPVDMLVTQNTPTAQAAKRATDRIPIVMSVAGDPVASGLVASLARPGGNVTGTTSLSRGVSVKWLELLKEVTPRLRRVAYLLNLDTKTATTADMHAAAKSLKLELREVGIRRRDELEGAFAAMVAGGAEAVAVQVDSMLTAERTLIAELSGRHRLPSAGAPNFAEAGVLIGYGQQSGGTYGALATFVDKILKGASPANLPVQQASQFRLVVNARAAKALGIKIPEAMLLRAEKVIE